MSDTLNTNTSTLPTRAPLTAYHNRHQPKVFGLASPGPALGFSQGGDANGSGDGGGGGDASREAVLGPVLDVLSEFRDRARGCGRAGNAKGVLAACDHVRDELLPTVGVRLEDKGDQVRRRRRPLLKKCLTRFTNPCVGFCCLAVRGIVVCRARLGFCVVYASSISRVFSC